MTLARLTIITFSALGLSACGVNHKSTENDDFRGQWVSTSLCGDSYVLAVAPERVAALSWQSRDTLSRASAAQRALPQIADRAEDILTMGGATVIFGPGEGYRTAKFTKASVPLTWGEDFETVWANLESLKAGSSKPWKDRLSQVKTPETTPKILYLSRAGGTAGGGTFIDAVITAAGGENIIKSNGWFTPDPETLLAQRPDFILTSFFDSDYASVNDKSYRHKAVKDFIAAHQTIDIEGKYWPCAGPGLIEATEILAAALRDSGA